MDGFLLYGVKYDWDIYKDYSIVQIAQAFNKIAFYIYTNLLSLDDTDTRLKNRSRRSLAKTVIRTLEWNAVLNGAPISHSINDYTDHIKKYVPQFLPTMKKAMNIYKKKIIIDTDVTFLEEILKANLAQLKK